MGELNENRIDAMLDEGLPELYDMPVDFLDVKTITIELLKERETRHIERYSRMTQSRACRVCSSRRCEACI
jgi:hypothetical protein